MKELLTIEQVADRLKLNPETVRRWLVSGKLKGNKLAGSVWRIEEQSLIAFIKDTPCQQ